jgi:hypothetical protein
MEAQDYFSALPFNPVLKEQSHQPGLKTLKSTADTLELPFIDDFSGAAFHLNPTHWVDNYVYVNNQYAVNPMSVGIATLDAYDQNGDVYTKTNINSVIPADTLTSAPLFMDIEPATGNSIFLTFYYQIGGLAVGVTANNGSEGAPDSLIVDFYRPSDDKWYKAWGTIPDSTTTTFERVDIEITDSLREDGFRFRFRNQVWKKRDSKFYEWAPWHLDYVMLMEGQEDDPRPTEDVAFTGVGDFLFMNGIKSIPWPHFAEARNEILNAGVSLVFNNFNFPNLGFATLPSFTIHDEVTGLEEQGGILNESYPIDSEKDTIFLDNLFLLSANDMDSARLRVEYNMQTELEQDILSNNSFSVEYPCKNYYAYDDGTAEGLLRALHLRSWASKFETFKPDTLRAIDIYMLPGYTDDKKTRYFEIRIYDQGNGGPGDLLLEVPGNEVKLTDRRNGFQRYDLRPYDSIVVDGEFYVGITNTTFEKDMIGIGVDVNSRVNNTYHLTDQNIWLHKAEEVPYALMIRPVFGKEIPETVSVPENPFENKTIQAFPNPARDVVHIKGIPSGEINYSITIHNSTGQLTGRYPNQSTINVSHLERGLYILTVQGTDWKSVLKMIITR